MLDLISNDSKNRPRVYVFGELRNLTGIRGLAALWVAAAHFQASTTYGTLQTNSALIGAGAWAVDIFFVLSGFILVHRYGEQFSAPIFDWSATRQFLIRRIARIYPLHLATFLATVLAWYVASLRGYQFKSLVDHGAEAAFLNLFLLQAWGFSPRLSWNAPSWSVSAEWFAYLFIFPVSARYLSRLKAPAKILLIVLLWASTAIYAGHFLHASVIHLTGFGILRIIPEFLSGVLAYQYVSNSRLNGNWCTLVGAVGILAVALAPISFNVLMLPFILIVLLGLYRGGDLTDAVFSCSLILALGEISYSLYLTHPLVDILCNQLVRSIWPNISSRAVFVLIAIKLIIAITVGAAAYLTFEKPSREFILRRFTNRRVISSQKIYQS